MYTQMVLKTKIHVACTTCIVNTIFVEGADVTWSHGIIVRRSITSQDTPNSSLAIDAAARRI